MAAPGLYERGLAGDSLADGPLALKAVIQSSVASSYSTKSRVGGWTDLACMSEDWRVDL